MYTCKNQITGISKISRNCTLFAVKGASLFQLLAPIVFGVISDIEESAITIDDNAYCLFDEKLIGLNVGEQIKIKGRCIGYDELLEVVKVDQSVILK